MEQSILNYIFNISIIIGLAMPILNIITGCFGSFFNIDADIDIDTDIDMSGDTSFINHGGSIHFNIMCACLFLVVFGVFGQIARKFMTSLLLMIPLIAACLIIAGISYVLLYKFLIRKLKENNASAISYNDLKGKRGEVTLSISGCSVGVISIIDSTGAYISFRAKIDPDLKDIIPETIRQGESIIITDVDLRDKICFVSTNINKTNIKLGG